MNTPKPRRVILALMTALLSGPAGAALAADAANLPPPSPAASAVVPSAPALIDEITVTGDPGPALEPMVTVEGPPAQIDDGRRALRLEFRPSLRSKSLFRLSMR